MRIVWSESGGCITNEFVAKPLKHLRMCVGSPAPYISRALIQTVTDKYVVF
jgi:hypothetical protein